MAATEPGTAVFEDMREKVENASKDDGNPEQQRIVDEIESLCMNCHENGTTRLLLTKIPFFKEIIIMSFHCSHCEFTNSEIQPAGEIQQQGQRFTFKVGTVDDLSRQLVKSDTCVLKIEEIDLEVPPGRGQLTNVEGILAMIAQDLQSKQTERKSVAPELFEKLQAIIQLLEAMLAGMQLPFSIILDDPAGNSWVEPSSADGRGKLLRTHYPRTPEQNADLGLGSDDVAASASSMRPEYHATQMYPTMPAGSMKTNVDAEDDDEIVENQVYSFPATCPGCSRPCATHMKMVNIPHFKQVVIMSTVCEDCGYRTSEVKTGGEVPEKGRRITVTVDGPADLSRDILKSESCALECPELDLRVEPGTMGGKFTTIEGLLTQVRNDLHSSMFSTGDSGDSMPSDGRQKWDEFFAKLDTAIRGDTKFHIQLEDPLAASYVQSFKAPEPDDQLRVEEYDRTEEEEEDLGLRDMKTEGYEEDNSQQQSHTTEGEKA